MIIRIATYNIRNAHRNDLHKDESTRDFWDLPTYAKNYQWGKESGVWVDVPAQPGQ